MTPQDVSLSANTEGARLFVNDQIVPTGKLIGRLYPPIHLRAEAPAGYRFSQWKLVGGKVTGTQQTLNPSRSESSYYDKGSVDATATWNTSAYNDSRWSKGNGPLGYAKDNTQFSTILDYGGDTSNRRTTFYFRQKRNKAIVRITQLEFAHANNTVGLTPAMPYWMSNNRPTTPTREPRRSVPRCSNAATM